MPSEIADSSDIASSNSDSNSDYDDENNELHNSDDLLASLTDFDEASDDSGAVGAAAAQDEVYTWKVNHASGDHKLRRRSRPAGPK